MHKLLYIFLLLSSIQYSESIELNALDLHPEIDTSRIVSIQQTDLFLDVYTQQAGYRFNHNLDFLEKFFIEDTILKKEKFIISVDYLNGKKYIGTYNQGLFVLNDNLEIENYYNSINSDLKYSKSCGSVYDSINRKTYSENCGFGLFVLDENGNQGYIDSIDNFLKFMGTEVISIIDNKYYLSVVGYDYDINFKEELIITDNNFKIIDTINFAEKYNLSRNIFHEIFEVNNHIAYYSGNSRIVIIENKITKESKLIDLSTLDAKGVSSFAKFNDNLVLCTDNGLFVYDLTNKRIDKININNNQNRELSYSFYDFTKFTDGKFLAGSGKGVYILDNETTNENSYYSQKSSDYYIYRDNEIQSLKYNLTVEVFNIQGQKIFTKNNFESINLENVTKGRGVFLLVISIDNSIIATEKFIKN